MTKEEIRELTYTARGGLIDNIIGLERAVDICLSNYFSDSLEKEIEIMHLIFGNERITFGNKREILDYLCKHKKINLLEGFPTILTDINNIIKFRNILAHYLIMNDNIAQELPDRSLQFMKFRNSMTRITYTEQYLVEIASLIGRITKHIANNTPRHN